jgi:DNA polymerase III subunit delta
VIRGRAARGILAVMSSAAASPATVTLLVGPERFLAVRALKELTFQVRAIDATAERRDIQTDEPGALGELQGALSPSLFGDTALVVVRAVEDAAAQVQEALIQSLVAPPPGIWVVVEHSGARSRALLERLRKEIPEVAEIPCAEIKKGRATREFLEGVARGAGRRITADGVEALVQAVGSDIALLIGALEQVLADHPGGVVDSAAVANSFVGVAEVTGFQLADAVWEAHSRLALQRLRWGLTSQTVTGAGVVGSLAAGLRSMVRVAGAPRGVPEAEVARLAGVPPFKVAQLRKTSRGWRPAQLADAVVDLADVDAQVKGGVRPGENLETSQKLHSLERFILSTPGDGAGGSEGPTG